MKPFELRARELFTQTLRLSEKDINRKITGELLEASCEDISYWYGNGELIASNDRNVVVFGLDYNGFNYSWVMIEAALDGVAI